jgi:hypothetical protein
VPVVRRVSVARQVSPLALNASVVSCEPVSPWGFAFSFATHHKTLRADLQDHLSRLAAVEPLFLVRQVFFEAEAEDVFSCCVYMRGRGDSLPEHNTTSAHSLSLRPRVAEE